MAEKNLGLPPQAVEFAAVFCLTAVLAAWLGAFAYRDTLSEYDLYAAAIGLWDGQISGEGLRSRLHYYVWLSFGWIEFIAALAPGDALGDAQSLMRFLNSVGFVSTLLVPALTWWMLRLAHGGAIAVSATAMFVLSPIFLEIAGTGHPLLPGLVSFLVGGVLLFLPAYGWRRAVLWAAATALLALALLLRFELAFAFPFLVLARPRAETLRDFVANAAARALPGVGAIAIFYATRFALLDPHAAGGANAFLDQWYDIANTPKGVVAAGLSAGVALSVAALWATARVGGALWRDRAALTSSLQSHARFLAPLVLIATAAVFWLPNPLPARHFVLFVLGTAILVALALDHARPNDVRRLMLTALAIVVVNQAAAFATAPLAARLSPSKLETPAGVLVPAPAEPAWTRRAALRERSENARRLALRIANDSCAHHLVVLSDQSPALVTGFLQRGRRPSIEIGGAFPGAHAYFVRENGRTIAFIQRNGAHSTDALPAVLSDPDYAGAAIFIDPMMRRRDDSNDIPPERAETFACGVRGPTP